MLRLVRYANALLFWAQNCKGFCCKEKHRKKFLWRGESHYNSALPTTPQHQEALREIVNRKLHSSEQQPVPIRLIPKKYHAAVFLVFL